MTAEGTIDMAMTGRRTLLAGMLAAGAGAALTGKASAAPALRLDPAKTQDQGLIFRKLAYATDERLGFSWLRGTRYGLIATDPVPLWEMHVGSLFRVRDLPEGRYEVTSLSTSFYTDLQTGKFLSKFHNPLTDQTIDVNYFPPRPSKAVYDSQGPVGAAAPPGLTKTDRIGPAWIEGEQVWVRGDVMLRGQPSAPGQRPIRVNDLSTYFGLLRDVADPAVKMPLAGHMFSDINSWPKWLGMGDRPGDYYSRCLGHKVASLAAMPKVWRDLMMDQYPAVMRDPAAALHG